MSTNVDLPAEKVIEQLRRQLDAANFQLAQTTAACEVLGERAVTAENRVTELESQADAARPEK